MSKFLPARRCVSAVLASVCPSVCHKPVSYIGDASSSRPAGHYRSLTEQVSGHPIQTCILSLLTRLARGLLFSKAI